MTPTDTPTDRFEERLLTELRAHVAERGARLPAPARRPTGQRVRRVAIAGGGVAVVAAVVGIAAGGDGAPPAYAVEPRDDGSVEVTIRSLTDADGLEAELRDAGIAADVTALEPGTSCKAERFRPARGAGPMSTSVRQTGDGATTFRLEPGRLADGQTLVITASAGKDAPTSLALAVADGEVAPCEPVAGEAPLPKGATLQSHDGPDRGLSQAPERK